MLRLQLSFLRSDFIYRIGFLLIATIVGNVFSYIYLILMGRALGPETFGIFGALFGIFYIVSLTGDALRIVIASQVATIRAEGSELVAIRTVLKPLIKLGLLWLIVPLFFMIGCQPIASFFHMSSTGPVFILGIALFSGLLLPMILGLLQGLQRFRHFAFSGYILPQGLKLLSGVVFIWAGFDLMGAIGALLVSTVIAIPVAIIPIRGLLTKDYEANDQYNPKLLGFVLPALLIAAFISFPTSIDVMLVTHFFKAAAAGMYNAAATLGKVVIFLPMAVAAVMLPKVSERYALGLDSRKLLGKSLIYTIFLCAAVAILYLLIPDILVKLFFGEAYLGAVSLIVWYGIAMIPFALNFLFVHYNLATQNRKQLLLAIAITLAEAVTIILLHQSLQQIILILLGGNLLLLASNFLALAILKRS